MRFFIDSLALQRIVDPKPEIRQRALAEIRAVLVNNILFEAQIRDNLRAEDELSVVNLAELTKQLIRWFQFKPIANPEDVFDILIMIFSRKDFLCCITQTLSVERLKKELSKIRSRLIPDESASKLEKIDSLLAEYEKELLVDIGHDIESFREVDRSVADNLTKRVAQLQTSCASPTSSKCDEDEDVFHEHWINLEGHDLSIFNSIDAELIYYKEPAQLSSVIKYIRATISDFPPEFYLQPPHILETLTDLLPKVSKTHSVEIVRIINFIINGLKDRYNEAKRNRVSYIPVKKHMNKILQMLTNFFERLHDNFDAATIWREQQELVNAIHLVLFDLAAFIRDTQNVCDIYLNEMMNMIAKVMKDFRTAYTSADRDAAVFRTNYIIELHIINALVSVIDVQSITSYCTSNAWEYECDLALLDWPLKMSHHRIYNLLRRNRSDIIEDDDDMKMLLYDLKKSWASVTNVFQKWHSMTDEDLLATGATCIDTIRIHRSLEFVEIMFATIEKCSAQFHTNEALKQSAERIVLRLLSIDTPEVRAKAYQLARSSVQRKLSEDQEEKLREMNLCHVIGIPISVEIVSEILCFGYTDTNEDTHKHAKLILFALLRAKIVFPNHWLPLLDIIKPVLPLFTCLFKNEQKLGFFAFDIFHEHAGFTKHELCFAFTRFLFCSHPKAREMAKIKLIENLFDTNEYSNDFIEIIPENFCILPRDQVKDLELLNRNIGYKDEIYQNIRSVLQSNKHNDIGVIKTVLVQLHSLMNSLKFTQRSHDDNLWAFFVINLDMGFPRDADIRRLVISILYKWAITVTSFRIYLARESSVLKFLVQSLIYCQDDPSIKKCASTLLFVLAFSDFIVASETSISLPQFIRSLEHPFKFEEHWDTSPFNQVSQLELLHEALQDKSEHVDVKEITMKYLRFTLAEVWLGNCKNAFSEKVNPEKYYSNCGSKTLQLPQQLLLTEADNKLLLDTSLDTIFKKTCSQYMSVETLGQVQRAIQSTIAVLMLPHDSVWKIAEKLENVIKMFSEYAEKRCERQKSVLIECLELYANIVPWLSDKLIADTFGRKTFFEVFEKSILFDEGVYTQMLQLFNSVVEMCKTRPSLIEMLTLSFNANHKLHFASNLVEKLFEQLTEVVLKDKTWVDITKIPFVRIIFTLLNNTLRNMPTLLDESYMNTLFRKFLHATRSFLKSKDKDAKSCYLNAQIINQIFATIETLASMNYKYNLTHEEYSTMFLWLIESVNSSRTLIWSIVATLTRKKEGFDSFTIGFKTAMNFSLNDILYKAICNARSIEAQEQKALALVTANFIDHAIIAKLDISDNGSNFDYITLAKAFLSQKQMNTSALAFVVKKMEQRNVQEISSIIRRKKFVQKFLRETENLHVVTALFNNPVFTEHVGNVVSDLREENVVELLSHMQHSIHDTSKVCEAKQINCQVLNIIPMLINTPFGLERLRKIFRYTDILEKVVLVLYEGLHSSNGPAEIIFHLDILNALIRSNCAVYGDEDCVFKIRDSNYFPKIVRDVEGSKNAKAYSIYELNIRQVVYPIDLLFLQVLDVFYASLDKAAIRSSAFLFIKTSLEKYDHLKAFASHTNVTRTTIEKTIRFVGTIQGNHHSEMTKKAGVQQCQQIIKKLCFCFKALTEWPISIEVSDNGDALKSLFYAILPVYDWVMGAEAFLTNSFLNFMQLLSRAKGVKRCIMQEVKGMPLIKEFLKRAQAISAKSPHTAANLKMLSNYIKTIESYCEFVEVRMVLKNAKILQILDVLYPQLQSRKSTWNDVTIIWLEFFEFLSYFEDSECTPGQISLLCRFIRMGNAPMKSHALKIVRNFSFKSSIGFATITLDDFTETIDTILSGPEYFAEKQIILQTLVCIVSKSEQSVAKIKNSSLNRKLKDHIAQIEELMEVADSPELNQIYDLSIMLKSALYS